MAGASLFDDFKLGVAGVGDLVAHTIGFDTTWAADEYAQQTADAEADETGHVDEERRKELQTAARKAEKTDRVVERAAKHTANKVAQNVVGTGEAILGGTFAAIRWLPWVAGGVVVVVIGSAVALAYSPAGKAAAKGAAKGLL